MSRSLWSTASCWLKITAYFIILTTRVKSVRGGFACLESPCFHGICIDYLDTNRSDTFWLNEDEALVDDDYRCYCRNGFTGYSCQINWDECSSNPCQNGGECLDGIASFNCSCPDNFTGSNLHFHPHKLNWWNCDHVTTIVYKSH
ncbi:Protein eyes shut [Folsomia candida]|uniref:Protein eyes shut n=1 Tax=Folsomia candida TaxID=158441 RepID=A0A226EPC6_FOLCA|nr:Protein eyes shut [Folsomia candida]